MEPFGNDQVPTLVPASLIQNQENMLVWSNVLFLCEGSQSKRKNVRSDCGQEQP